VFPRLKDRGLIEAPIPWKLQRRGQRTFPRLKDRGLIEASSLAIFHGQPGWFPRLKDRGLIEAR